MSTVPRSGTRMGDSPVEFRFDGQRVVGQEGDTVASALLANDIRLFARSIKLHRRRGVLTAGPEEPNALVTLGRAPTNTPNLPATVLTVTDGMEVFSQNRWPSLKFDLGSALSLGGDLFSAGFYYKTFMWPNWHSYESIIRRLAGLGKAPGKSDIPPPVVEHVDCQFLVVGGGPAGISAALTASRAGLKTMLCERDPVLGGELEFEVAQFGQQTAAEWVAAAHKEMQTLGIRVLTNTAVVGEAEHRVIAHCEPGGHADDAVSYRILADQVLMATGAIEQPIVFTNNDRPGVMLLGAAEKYLARYGVKVGKNAVIFGSHDRIYAAAHRLLSHGIKVSAVIDSRTDARPDAAKDLRDLGVECLSGHVVLEAVGRQTVTAVRIAPLASVSEVRVIDCDCVLVSGGWRQHAHANIGSSDFRMAAGAAVGAFELQTAIKTGIAAVSPSVAGQHGRGQDLLTVAASGDPAPSPQPLWRSPASLKDEKHQFVDLQNDVTVADLRQAAEQGFVDIEHAKRFTTLGVGTEQGETSGLIGAAILAEFSGQSMDTEPRVSRRRPPFQPATLSTLAGLRRGKLLRPCRRTQLHDWHVRHGAVLEETGGWQRPRYYDKHGSDPGSAADVESAAVRRYGGIVDASTLGKIEVAGPGAAEFLDRLYLTKASTIRASRSKYMVLLREDGMVLDDGIVLRLSEDRFLATISSGHAGHVLSHFAYHRARMPDCADVALGDVTEAWSVIAVSGPNSRETLQQLLGAEWQAPLKSLLHMHHVSGHWRGNELRVLRASFSGELAFELHCRKPATEMLWQSLVDSGFEPYGLEALDVLRIEKGYLTSAELNGQTTPMDLGLTRMVELGNACVGKDLLDRPALGSEQRERLVGIRALNPGDEFIAGAQLTEPTVSDQSCGHITSAGHSAVLGEWIGLALVRGSHATAGKHLLARDPVRGRETPVVVTAPVHFDPGGKRMKA